MINKFSKTPFFVALGFSFFCLCVFAFRFMDLPPNFSPVIAIGVFAGVIFKNRSLALGVVLLGMFLSDLILGFYSGWYFVYGSLAAIVIFASWSAGSFRSLWLNGLAGAVLFFAVTNFGVWLTSGLYAKSVSGWIACYAMALPFFHWSLISTALFLGVLCVPLVLSQKWLGRNQLTFPRI